jgi:hypothetical protein
MSSTSSSNKSGTHLLPILLVSMVLLVAAFVVLVATRAESAGASCGDLEPVAAVVRFDQQGSPQAG